MLVSVPLPGVDGVLPLSRAPAAGSVRNQPVMVRGWCAAGGVQGVEFWLALPVVKLTHWARAREAEKKRAAARQSSANGAGHRETSEVFVHNAERANLPNLAPRSFSRSRLQPTAAWLHSRAAQRAPGDVAAMIDQEMRPQSPPPAAGAP
jgi:hypothetical protein